MSFTLLSEDRLPRPPNPNERHVLDRIFPGNRGLSILGPFLIVTVNSLPQEPWPAICAGLPVYLTCKDFDIPWELGTAGNQRVHGLQHLNGTSHPSRALYLAVIQYFEEHEISIQQLVWITRSWRVTLTQAATETLPGKLCQVPVFYIFKDSDVLPRASIGRKKDAEQTVDDSVYYPHLRPGVMIVSESFTTTSGVTVTNAAGDKFVSVASHGFPAGEENIYHPQHTDFVIGTVENRIAETDIALARLSPGVNYENSTFANVSEPTGIQLKGFKDPFTIPQFSTLSMDTPFTGMRNPLFLTVSVQRIPNDSSKEHIWTSQTWNWLGQSHPPKDGCCGAALSDEDGYVIGLFRLVLAENEGIGIGAAAEELVNRGYTLL